MHLQLESFSYADGPRPVLRDIELNVNPGEMVLVAGGSGSGKTTLGLILAGVLPGQHRGTMHGRIKLDDDTLQFPAAQDARIDHQRWSGVVGYAGQDGAAQLSSIAPTVAEEIAFPLENAGMPRAQMQDRVRETAAFLGLGPLLDSDPAHLSGGQQKLVAIAAAVARRPVVLVLDEALAGLDYDSRTAVAAALHALMADGVGIVLLCQDLAGVGLQPGRVVLLHRGRTVFTGSRVEAARKASSLQLPVLDARIKPVTARKIPADPAAVAGGPPGAEAAPVIAAEGLRFTYGWRKPRPWRRRNRPSEPVLDGVNLNVAAGECVAVAGSNGSGKSTLLRLIAGLSVPQEGSLQMHVGEANGALSGPGGTMLGALLQHPREQLFERTVHREVGASLSHNLGEAVRGQLVDQALRRCRLLEVAGLHPYELSASEQRLTALAALLVQRPSIIALDEPTVSLDGPGLEILASVLAAEAARGAGIVMATHDLDFAYRTCDRLMVLSGGRPVADGLFEEVLESHFGAGVAYGVAAPLAWRP